MKIITLLILMIFSASLSASPIELKIEDIAEKVSNDNFMVLENAERVYQKKEGIKFARANLLPKLNIWNLLKLPAVFVDPLAVGDIIQDLAPFLVPANWFKVGQSKHLYRAQKEQYRALWANEVNTSKLLFYSVYRDKQFSELLIDKKSNYKELMEIARIRNIFGSGNIFAYNLIRDRYLSLVEDSRNLNNLVFNETKELQFLVGINNEEEVSLVRPALSDLENASKIEFSKIIFKAIEASPEVFQYEHLLNALAKIKGQINFSILGASTFSLGEGNGVFDHIPIQDGLGFGMGSSIKITKSEGRILKTQLKATIETIKKQVNVLVNEYNSLITNYRITQERMQLANSNYDSMISHISIGGTLDVLEMIEVLDNLYASKILLLSYRYRFSELVEKLKRITFSGDYSKGPRLNAGDQNE